MGSSPEGVIVIRRAEPGDYEGFAWVFEGATAQSETLQLPYPSRDAWRKRLADNDSDAHRLVALIEGKIVGHAGFHAPHPSPRRAHVAYFGMSVHDDYQGRGVGKALIRTALDLADRWTPVTRMELTVYADNARAIALYKQAGFEQEGYFRQHTLRDGRYVDTIAMARIRPKA
jgi:putative acetyltransferase